MTVARSAVFVLLTLYAPLGQLQDPQLISRGRSPHLEQYTEYADTYIRHFSVPDNTLFVSFMFVASEQDLSIFGCSTRNVSIYLKYGAPPAINPDGAPFPPEFKNVSRATTYDLEFLTDSKAAYINISSPEPGIYFSTTFLAYEDPRYRKISQQGLTQSCEAYVDASVYVVKVESPIIITEFQLVDVLGQSNQSRYFMFLVPEGSDHAIVNIENIKLSPSLKDVIFRVAARRPPTKEVFLLEKVINADSNATLQAVFRTEPRTWYYLVFQFRTESDESDTSELNFRLRYYSNRLPSSETFVTQTVGNTTLYNMSVAHKSLQSNRLVDVQPYKQFNLLRESTAGSFIFSYKLQPEIENSMFVPINVTNHEFTVLKFTILRGSDIGGTLQYILAFKPRVSRDGGYVSLLKEPENHMIVGCIQRNNIAVPTWPKYCISNEISMLSPIVLNQSVANSTVLIPYPESGVWYASFKLFCGTCEPCACPDSCQEEYERCVIECELNCTNLADSCENCVENCSGTILSGDECASCNCDGPCLRNSSSTCESSILFDVSSRPCYFGDCGKQGKCGLFISDGVAYSSCLCSNNYRGFDCSDGSLATPYSLVLLEFLLLILSNIFFLPATFIAFRREYYVEALSYFSIFLSSSFYHACDAGENILSFCIFRLSALQFADFFSALLAIWLTLLAMADLPPVQLSILQMGGSIIIAFCVTLNRYAFWIFALPSCVGIVIIGISWFLKYRKFRSRFIDKRYLYVKLPVGLTVVVIGLIIYGLLQTQDNYKYLHSLWHIIMATGVFFLLPKKDTFQAAALLS